MITVTGGTLPPSSQLAGERVAAFQIGKYEVTWGEWKEVRDWAVNNYKGYDLAGVGGTVPAGSGDDFPVSNVSWHEVVKWCNAKSEKENKAPVYQKEDGTTYKTGQVEPIVNSGGRGYRLPSEKEWEWAARGGVSSQDYTYSGSNTLNYVAWTLENNTPYGTKAVGGKMPNELEIYDMSGNVNEWCEDVTQTSYQNITRTYHHIRGGSWYHFAEICAVARRIPSPDPQHISFGFRLARSSGN
jgi:formylglycine-generating enzyme required for sulfatase activity